jgi:hypothetical protein
MPDKQFLEEAPLYQSWKREIGMVVGQLIKVSINMHCEQCGSAQTFNMVNEYVPPNTAQNAGIGRRLFHLEYACAHCRGFHRNFYVLIDAGTQVLTKVGQYPPWDISGNKNIERMLGDHRQFLRRGLVCESQSYGIGAFAYYRRIVETIIDELLDSIAEMLTGPELATYEAALEQTKKTRVTQDKIALVKDLLPKSLRPDGMNPLDVLHGALSEGLHEKSEEECLEVAEHLRTVLIFLVGQVAAHKATAKEFSESMKALLEKRAKRKADEKAG